jgi:hypothetical protein
MCVARWSWIKEAMLADHTLSSQDIAEKALDYIKNGVCKSDDRIVKIMNEDYK